MSGRNVKEMAIRQLNTAIAVTVLATAGLLTGIASPASAAVPTYTVEALGDFVPQTINESGHVVGWQGYPTQAVVYTDGVGLSTLPPLNPGEAALARDINDQGQVVGQSGSRAVRWTNGVAEDLGVLDPTSPSAEAYGINNLGNVSGSSTKSGGTHAFFHSEATGMVDLFPTSTGPGFLSYGHDINELNQVAGYVGSRAFRWTDGTIQDLGVPDGYALSYAWAINDSGQVAGQVKTATGSATRVARYTDGTGWEILGGSGEDNQAWGINNDGTVVGQAWVGGPITEAVVYIDGSGLLGLDDLAPGSDYTFMTAWDINDAGQIAVSGFSKVTGEYAALRLTPSGGTTPPPSNHTLTVTKSGSGTVTSTPAGIDCGADCSEAYAAGTAVTLSATPSTGNTFTGWSGACTGTASTCTVTMDAAKSATASFAASSGGPYTLTVTNAGKGKVTSSPAGISCGRDCSEAYASGTAVTLTATPASGQSFTGWSGACSGTATTCTVTMDAAKSVTATFGTGSESPPPSGDTYTLTVTKEGAGRGRVTSSPAGISCGTDCSEAYASGTAVTLTATPASGSVFTGWSGACSGTGSTCTVAMDAAKTATGTFA